MEATDACARKQKVRRTRGEGRVKGIRASRKKEATARNRMRTMAKGERGGSVTYCHDAFEPTILRS